MKEIKGYEGLYSIDENGVVVNLKTNRALGGTLDKDGYRRIGLVRDKKQKMFLHHRLVCETYHDNPEMHPHVDHIDGNRDNNKPSNLQWMSVRDNVDKAKQYIRESVYLKGPNGEIVEVACAYEFASQTGLSKESVRRLVKGEIKKTEGWTLSNPSVYDLA